MGRGIILSVPRNWRTQFGAKNRLAYLAYLRFMGGPWNGNNVDFHT